MSYIFDRLLSIKSTLALPSHASHTVRPNYRVPYQHGSDFNRALYQQIMTYQSVNDQ